MALKKRVGVVQASQTGPFYTATDLEHFVSTNSAEGIIFFFHMVLLYWSFFFHTVLRYHLALRYMFFYRFGRRYSVKGTTSRYCGIIPVTPLSSLKQAPNK